MLLKHALTISAAVLLNPENASACFCASPDLSRSIRNAQAIFSAKAIEVSPKIVVLEVGKVWKGRVAERLTLHSTQSSCDLRFEVGETYLVYARKYKDWLSGEYRWSTDQCARSRRMAEAKEDLLKLRELVGGEEQRERYRIGARNLTRG